MTGEAPIVVVDACVLVTYDYTCILLGLADAGLIEVRWSSEILAELERTLIHRLGLAAGNVQRRIEAMTGAFPLADVLGWEALEPRMTCNSKDRHVLAAAVVAEADYLLTDNLKDFPEDSWRHHGVELIDPDSFLLEVNALAPAATLEAIRVEAARRKNPPMTARDLLAVITQRAPTAANMMAHSLDDPSLSDDPNLPVTVITDERSPAVAAFESGPDLTKPLHVALIFAQELAAPANGARRLHNLQALVAHPRAWGDFAWAVTELDGLGCATDVYTAVDRPNDLAFVRFVETAHNVRVFRTGTVRARWRFATMVRLPDSTWRVWGLGGRLVSWAEVTA